MNSLEYIPPLMIRVFEYNVHAKVKIKGHREYDCIEVMSHENCEGRIFVSVILSLHDGSSVRYINDHNIVELIKLEAPARQVHYCAIEYDYQAREFGKFLNFRLFTDKNEEIVGTLMADTTVHKTKMPMYKPSGFVRHRELPLGFSFYNFKMNERTWLKINNREYKIITSREILGFSFGHFGRMSDNYTRINLIIPPERSQIKRTPASLSVGEGWSFSAGKRCLSYDITEVLGETFTTTRGKEAHKLVLKDDGLYLLEIINLSGEKSTTKVSFNPPLPVAPNTLKYSCRMTVSSDDDTVYEATIYCSYENESNRFDIVGDKIYPTKGDNICYEVRIADGWVFTSTTN